MQLHSSPAPGWRALAAWPIVLCMGCSGSGDLQPVEGQVLYKKEPVKGVVVTFHPKTGDPIKAIRPIGVTDESGTFTLTTGDKAGAPTGEYSVTFIWPKEVPVKGKKPLTLEWTGPADTPDYFGGALANAKTSAFNVELKRGHNKLDPFHLK